jgi:hypothetical protein
MLADARVIPRRVDFEGEAPNQPASRKAVVVVANMLSCRTPKATNQFDTWAFEITVALSGVNRQAQK